MIGDSGHFRPVVWTLADTEVLFAPSKITIVSNTPVLVSRNEVSGTGNFYFEDYFVFDDPAGLPLNLRFDSAIAEELTRILPAGREVRKGGGFDIESLHYTQRVWTDGDANCCPSAGKVDIQFAILGNAAVVIKATYDPAYKWPS